MTHPKKPNSPAHAELDDLCESRAERAARVARLRWAVKAGAYDPDPAVIAATMLCGPRAIFGAATSHSRG